jgi:hypothetical protein
MLAAHGGGNPWEDRNGRCSYCDDQSHVLVPDPKYVRAGEWKPSHYRLPPHPRAGEGVYVTRTVTCDCFSGRRVHDLLVGREQRPLSLTAYKQFNPLWQEHMQERQAAERQASEAERSAWSRLANLDAIAKGIGTPIGKGTR